MKKCKSCQKEIDNKAKKCPYCQASQRGWFRRHPILTGILIFVVIGIIGSASGGSKGGQTNNTTSQTAQKQEVKQEPTIVEATALIGEFDKNKLSANEK